MRIRNQHPDVHAANSVETWGMTVVRDGTHWKYMNGESDDRTFKPFRRTGLEGMRYLLRTSGYDCSSMYANRLPDGSFVCTSTLLKDSDVWVDAGESCTPTEYGIVIPAEFEVMQAVDVGCFVAETASY